MHATLEKLSNALDQLSQKVVASWSDDRTLREVHGWNHPAVDRHDLAQIASDLADRIRSANLSELSEESESWLADYPRRLNLLHSETLPNMFNGNGLQAIPAYLGTLEILSSALGPVIGWVPNPDNQMMPAPMARRLRSYHATLDQLVPDTEKLRSQLAQIEAATAAAESLPTDLEDLAEARKKVGKTATDASELWGKLEERDKEVASLLALVKQHEGEAKKLVDQCEQAYRITTTKGLAAAFDQRAFKIAFSMWVWVLGLLAALCAATYLGAERVKLLSSVLSGDDLKWGVIFMHALLSLLSVGGPLWFAWVATKQLAQRFRLAEDYGYKASVAKAYEGYRKEAARLDPIFEARLFSSALTRLEEPPLRLIQGQIHGSPWHELITSEEFTKALEIIPELRDRFITIAEKGVSAVKGFNLKKTPTTATSDTEQASGTA